MSPSPCRKTFFSKADLREPAGSLYVHVPFCRAKCRYCDFCSVAYHGQRAQQVVSATIRELGFFTDSMQAKLATAFIGGGTPTVLDPEALDLLLAAIAPRCDAQTELTVEANPNSVETRKLGLLRARGVNRLSLGVQSFNPQELETLGRLHSPDEARRAWAAARSAGFDNLSLDLIYGVPGQTLESWRASIDQALELSPEHVSCYCLSYESGTPLAEDLSAGRVEPMDEELQRECYYHAIQRLARAGLEQYEISNFARPGRQCRHNLTYWHNEPYVGVGPAAVSYLGGQRSVNTSDFDRYLADIAAARRATESCEQLAGRALQAETLMLGLRLREGVGRAAFRRRFGVDPVEAFKTPILRHFDIGMLQVTPERVALTSQALFVADSVLADIVADAAPY